MEKQLSVVKNQHDIAVTDEFKELLLNQIMPKGSTHHELELFLYNIKRSKLDPFARQIYAIKRNGKMSYEVSIDGARLIAERSGLYRGQKPPMWCGEDGEWKDVWLKSTYPIACKVSVYRADFMEPLSAIALWKEYCPEGNMAFMWKKMPALMLSKVAEALALRRAFPNELSGYYTDDEMAQAKIDIDPRVTLKKLLFKLTNDAKNHEAIDLLAVELNVKSLNDVFAMPLNQMLSCISFLEKKIEDNPELVNATVTPAKRTMLQKIIGKN